MEHREDNYDNVLVATVIMEAELASRPCVRCNKVFVPPKSAKSGSASYYRCQSCLSSKAILSDLYTSTCNIS